MQQTKKTQPQCNGLKRDKPIDYIHKLCQNLKKQQKVQYNTGVQAKISHAYLNKKGGGAG